MRAIVSETRLFPERRIRHAATKFSRPTEFDLRPIWSHGNSEELHNWVECNEGQLCDGRNESAEFSSIGTANVTELLDVGDSANKSLSDDIADVQELYRIVIPVMLVACFVSIVFNLTIVISARWIRRTLSPTLCLSLSLAMADAYASLVLGLGLVINSLLPIVYGLDLGPFNACYILVLEAFRLGGVVVAVMHLLALAVNHYIGILRPLHYAATVTRRSALVAIAAMWVLPMVFFFAYFSLVPDDGFQSQHCSTFTFLLYSPFRLTTSLIFFVPLLLMSVMYVHMFVVVRQHQRGLLQMPCTRQLHKNVKAIITTLLILGTYVLGWMPAVLFYILTCLDCPVPFNQIRLWIRVPVALFANSMIVLKSFVDPIIYVVRMPEIKNALKAIWRTRCGAVVDETVEHQMYSRTDINRMTVSINSRKLKHNDKNNAHSNDKEVHFT